MSRCLLTGKNLFGFYIWPKHTEGGRDRDNNMRHVIAVKFYCSHVAYWEKQHDAAKEEAEVEVAKARQNKDSTVAAKTKESKTRRKSNRRVRCASFFP